MTTPGGTGMDFGDDYVAARLSIDIPQEGIQGVRELTEGIERFRTSMEAATRAEADMSRYLDQMAESSKRAAEAQANLTQQLSTYVSLNMRMQGMTSSSGVPSGPMQQPWAGQTAGMGLPTPPGSRMPNPSDVVYQLNNAATRSPREYLNMQQARGNVTGTDAVNISPSSIQALADKIAERDKAANQQAHKTGDSPSPPKHPPPHQAAGADPYDKFQQRAAGATGLLGSVMNEVGSGGPAGFGQLALQGLNYARKRLGDRSHANASSSGGGDPSAGDPQASDPANDGTAGLGGLTKGMGVAGGVLTAALAAFGLIQKGGAMVQGWRDIASPGGGAGGEGFQASVRARQLALDPTLSSEQTRQIYQAMISEKYSDSSGSGGEDVRNLMIRAIKDWNMSVPEFVAASRLTAKFTQVSTQAFGDYMSQIREQSKTGWLSQQDIRSGVINTATQLQAQGVPRDQSFQQALQLSTLFADSPTLAGTMMHAPSANMGAMERMYGGIPVPRGLLPQNTSRWLGGAGKEPEARLNALRNAPGGAMWCKNHYHDTSGGTNPQDPNWQNAVSIFFTWLQQVDPESKEAQNQDLAGDLYNELVWSGKTSKSIIAEGKAVHDKATAGQRVTGTRTGGYGGSPKVGEGRFRPSGPAAYGNEVLDRVLEAYNQDASQIEVMTPNGPQKLDASNKEQIDKLGSGEYKWRHKGDKGGGITMTDTPEGIGSGFSTDHPDRKGRAAAETSGKASTGPGGGGADQAKVQIDLTPDAKKYLQVVGPNPTPLSPNDIAANTGQGDAQVNNPPPGDAPTTGRWRHR